MEVYRPGSQHLKAYRGFTDHTDKDKDQGEAFLTLP